jgi:hypothetical protein
LDRGPEVALVIATERDLMAAVLDLARLLGWRVAHFRPARTERGWRTPVEGDGAGFPDLVLVRGERLVFAELKGSRGRVTPAQSEWLRALSAVEAVETAIWTLRDWDAIEEALR